MKNLRSSLGCFLRFSIFLQVFVEAKFENLFESNVETQNLVNSGNAINEKIARLEPFFKLKNTQDEDEKDVSEDNDEYDYDFDEDAELSFVKLIQEGNNRYARLEQDNGEDLRHARLIPNEEHQRFSKLIRENDDDVDLNVYDVGDSDVNDNDTEDDIGDNVLVDASEDDDVSGVDSKLVRNMKGQSKRKYKATKGKGKTCARKCRGKGRGRKSNNNMNKKRGNKVSGVDFQLVRNMKRQSQSKRKYKAAMVPWYTKGKGKTCGRKCRGMGGGRKSNNNRNKKRGNKDCKFRCKWH